MDLLGLGMMAVIKDSLPWSRSTTINRLTWHSCPRMPLVYETLQHADTVGMFQVESRAQMASLPRNHPDKFYDLVVQVAIIRPGPL